MYRSTVRAVSLRPTPGPLRNARDLLALPNYKSSVHSIQSSLIISSVPNRYVMLYLINKFQNYKNLQRHIQRNLKKRSKRVIRNRYRNRPRIRAHTIATAPSLGTRYRAQYLIITDCELAFVANNEPMSQPSATRPYSSFRSLSAREDTDWKSINVKHNERFFSFYSKTIVNLINQKISFVQYVLLAVWQCCETKEQTMSFLPHLAERLCKWHNNKL